MCPRDRRLSILGHGPSAFALARRCRGRVRRRDGDPGRPFLAGEPEHLCADSGNPRRSPHPGAHFLAFARRAWNDDDRNTRGSRQLFACVTYEPSEPRTNG